MKANLMFSVKRSLLLEPFWPLVLRWELKRWRAAGAKAVPLPHLVKQQTVREYASRFPVTVFIETGTYLGFMTAAVSHQFSVIYSIELDPLLWARARRKFKRYRHINIIQGDSACVLPNILNGISEPCLFWLDAHYSGGLTTRSELQTPIIVELNQILSHARRNRLKHILLIDDARGFDGRNDYPTLEAVHKLFAEANLNYVFDVKDDIIRAHP